MNKNHICLLLVITLLASVLAGCGGTSTAESASSASAQDVQSEPNTVETAQEPEVQPSETAVEVSAGMDSAAGISTIDEPEEEPEEELRTITYPIEGGAHFTMVACRNNVTAEVYANGGYELTPVYEAISEATGVTFDFEMLAEQTYSEKLNLKMASGDLPDVINSNIGQYSSNPMGAIEDDILMDIAPLLEENAPDYMRFLAKYPEVKVAVYNADGSTSCFKSSGYPYKSKGLNIRRDWLEQLGMEAPTTFEEVTEVLKAFQSEMGASMPLLVTSDLGSGLEPYFDASYSGFRSIGFMLTGPDSGEVVCCFASEGFLNYLDYLHELYDLGLVNNDFLTTGREYGNFEATYLSGKSGIWEDGSMQYMPALLSNGGEGYDPMPFVLSGEEEIHVSDVSAYDFIAGCNYVTAKCNDPVSCVQFFNYCYTEPGQMLYNFGVEGVSYEYDENGEIQYTEMMTNNPNGWAMNLCRSFYTGMWLCGEGMYRPVELQNDARAMEAINLWSDNAGDKSMLLPSEAVLSSDESMEFNTLAGDVLTAFTENTVKVVVGDISLDDYRALIEQLNTTGLDRMTELYQGAYDRVVSGS